MIWIKCDKCHFIEGPFDRQFETHMILIDLWKRSHETLNLGHKTYTFNPGKMEERNARTKVV